MAKYLAIFSDMIDEVEINGFIIMSDKEVENFEDLASSITWPFTYEFENGSEIEYSDGEDLLSRIEFKELNSDRLILASSATSIKTSDQRSQKIIPFF